MNSPVTRIVAIIAAVMVLAIIVYNLTSPSGPAGQPEAVPLTNPGSEAMSIDFKLAQLKKDLDAAYTSGQAREISLTLTEPEANEAAVRQIRASGSQIAMQIKGISVDIQKGNLMQISIDAVTFGITYSMTVTANIRVNNGALDIQINSVEVPLLLTSYKDSISGMVKQETELMLKQLTSGGLGYDSKIDLQFTDVQTDDSSIIVKALAKPKG